MEVLTTLGRTFAAQVGKASGEWISKKAFGKGIAKAEAKATYKKKQAEENYAEKSKREAERKAERKVAKEKRDAERKIVQDRIDKAKLEERAAARGRSSRTGRNRRMART